MLFGDKPDWYVGLKTYEFGDYFGSKASLWPSETYVTYDLKYIVHRPAEGKVTVRRNACAHRGAPLFNTPGAHDVRELRCPIHKWAYKPTGELVAAPYFTSCEGISLAAPKFGTWNGYILGYPQEELDAVLGAFGNRLGLGAQCLNPEEFVFIREEQYPLPYPRTLMMVNYFDGYHVPLCHQKTFDAVADCESYDWELGSGHGTYHPGYSIQLVRARRDVQNQMKRLSQFYSCEASALGWADFHLWIKEHLSGVQTPIDQDIFAVWAAIYGNGHLMPELYEGGLFLAVSSLVNLDPQNPETGNSNLVEYYVHKSVPETLRDVAAHKFRRAYKQSAEEDDEICMKLWEAHRLGSFNFSGVYHELLEKGDVHWREWFRRHFVKQ